MLNATSYMSGPDSGPPVLIESFVELTECGHVKGSWGTTQHAVCSLQGLRYQSDFVSAKEELALIAAFPSLPLAPFQFGAFEGKRRVASFSYRYDFRDQQLHEAAPLPVFITPLVSRVETFAGLEGRDQTCALQYESGAGIGWHRDKAAFDVVLGLSLGSACPFRFRRKEGSGWKRFTLEAAPRAIYLMDGDARALWEHSIAPVVEPRWSITFRTMAPDRGQWRTTARRSKGISAKK